MSLNSHPVYHTFLDRYQHLGHCLCVGLDPDFKHLPASYSQTVSGMSDYLYWIINETHQDTIAYKPNISFFEAMGIDGLKLLETLIKTIKDKTKAPVILDAKRGDIGNTAKMQAKFIYDYYGADATTINPYMGLDAVQPFLDYKDKFHFVLALTSNPSASDIEKQRLSNDMSVYEYVSDLVCHWVKENENAGIVVGGTQDELQHLRSRDKSLLYLIPGVGAQGATYQKTFSQGANKDGLAIINASRAVIYSDDPKGAIRQLINS